MQWWSQQRACSLALSLAMMIQPSWLRHASRSGRNKACISFVDVCRFDIIEVFIAGFSREASRQCEFEPRADHVRHRVLFFCLLFALFPSLGSTPGSLQTTALFMCICMSEQPSSSSSNNNKPCKTKHEKQLMVCRPEVDRDKDRKHEQEQICTQPARSAHRIL